MTESSVEAVPADPGVECVEFAERVATLGRHRRTLQRGRVGVDGFQDRTFEAKLERERRYGEVYALDEYEGGCLLRLELARRVPDSAVKRSLGVADAMPAYTCSAAVQDGWLTLRGSITDPEVRRIAAFSTAFPPDFHTEVELPRPADWKVSSRVADGTLEVVAWRE